MAKDVGETADLSESMPEKAAELHKKLRDYLKAVDAERIEDMRAARRKELLAYSGRTEKEIGDLQERLRNAADGREKQKLKERLADRRRHLENHKNALERLKKAEQMKAW